jgi:hypothetical protein
VAVVVVVVVAVAINMQAWSPALTLKTMLLSIIALLTAAEPTDPQVRARALVCAVLWFSECCFSFLACCFSFALVLSVAAAVAAAIVAVVPCSSSVGVVVFV